MDGWKNAPKLGRNAKFIDLSMWKKCIPDYLISYYNLNHDWWKKLEKYDSQFNIFEMNVHIEHFPF